MTCYNIMTVLVNGRSKKVPEVQNVFTKFGCIIKVRIGLHEAEDVCSDEGLIILQLAGRDEEIGNLESELNKIEGVAAKNMIICAEFKLNI